MSTKAEELVQKALTEATVARSEVKAVAEASIMREKIWLRSFDRLESGLNNIGIQLKADNEKLWSFLWKAAIALIGLLIANLSAAVALIWQMAHH